MYIYVQTQSQRSKVLYWLPLHCFHSFSLHESVMHCPESYIIYDQQMCHKAGYNKTVINVASKLQECRSAIWVVKLALSKHRLHVINASKLLGVWKCCRKVAYCMDTACYQKQQYVAAGKNFNMTAYTPYTIHHTSYIKKRISRVTPNSPKIRSILLVCVNWCHCICMFIDQQI